MTDRRSGAREWRLYIVAAVASVYVVAWSRISPTPQAATAAPASTAGSPAATVAPPASHAVWIDQLPSGKRPAIAPPAGWRLASRTETAAPVPQRVPTAAPRRIRTRSS